jgi:hypothetical protein
LTWQALIRDLEASHPRKDECIEFVAFGVHDFLLVRYENGRSQMILPDHPGLRSQISTQLIAEVEERLQAGWTLGNRTTLCSFDTNRWFIEWRRGTSSEFRFSLGLDDRDIADLERIKRVLSGVGSNGTQVANNQTAALVSPGRLNNVEVAANHDRLRQTRDFGYSTTLVGSCRILYLAFRLVTISLNLFNL